MHTTLTLSQIEFNIIFGWHEKERLQKQTITMDMDLRFPEPPLACTTDQLEDTICYHSLIQSIQKHLNESPFRLLEHASHAIYQLVKNTLPADCLVNIRINKNLNVVNLTGNASFSYGDKWSF